jgi:CheY-like chemotaxis protein
MRHCRKKLSRDVASSSIHQGATSLTAPRVLVVTDDSGIVAVVARVLTDLLCHYEVVLNAAAGVRSLHGPAGYDLAITTSLEFVADLRVTEGHTSTYVILIGGGEPLGVSADDVLAQPMRQEQLVASVVRGLSNE